MKDIKIDSSYNNGGKTDYYSLPKNAETLSDLIEYKQMQHGIGEMFKAIYALQERANRSGNSFSSEVRELNKIIWFAERRLAILKKEEKPKVSIEEHKNLY